MKRKLIIATVTAALVGGAAFAVTSTPVGDYLSRFLHEQFPDVMLFR